MKFVYVCFMLFGISSPNQHAREILNQWMTAHNSGSWSSFESFIESTYSTELIATSNRDEHAAFYDALRIDFGMVEPFIYEVIHESPTHLEVYLLKSGANSFEPPSTDVLVVSLELSKANPRKLGKRPEIIPLSCQQQGTQPYQN